MPECTDRKRVLWYDRLRAIGRPCCFGCLSETSGAGATACHYGLCYCLIHLAARVSDSGHHLLHR